MILSIFDMLIYYLYIFFGQAFRFIHVLMRLFVPDFLVQLEYNPLSNIYFVNIFFFGLCLSFVNKVFHSLNL